MAIETYTAQLERVQALIAEIESSSNKATSVNGRSFAKHEIKDLYDREMYLRAMAKRDVAGGGITVQQIAPL